MQDLNPIFIFDLPRCHVSQSLTYRESVTLPLLVQHTVEWLGERRRAKNLLYNSPPPLFPNRYLHGP